MSGFTTEQKTQLVGIFKYFDRDADGRWRYEELREARRVLGGDAFDHDDYIGLCEEFGVASSGERAGLSLNEVAIIYTDDAEALQADYNTVQAVKSGGAVAVAVAAPQKPPSAHSVESGASGMDTNAMIRAILDHYAGGDGVMEFRDVERAYPVLDPSRRGGAPLTYEEYAELCDEMFAEPEEGWGEGQLRAFFDGKPEDVRTAYAQVRREAGGARGAAAPAPAPVAATFSQPQSFTQLQSAVSSASGGGVGLPNAARDTPLRSDAPLPGTNDMVRALLEHFDTDGDGWLSFGEVQRAIGTLDPSLAPLTHAVYTELCDEMFAEPEEGWGEGQLRAFYDDKPEVLAAAYRAVRGAGGADAAPVPPQRGGSTAAPPTAAPLSAASSGSAPPPREPPAPTPSPAAPPRSGDVGDMSNPTGLDANGVRMVREIFTYFDADADQILSFHEMQVLMHGLRLHDPYDGGSYTQDSRDIGADAVRGWTGNDLTLYFSSRQRELTKAYHYMIYILKRAHPDGPPAPADPASGHHPAPAASRGPSQHSSTGRAASATAGGGAPQTPEQQALPTVESLQNLGGATAPRRLSSGRPPQHSVDPHGSVHSSVSGSLPPPPSPTPFKGRSAVQPVAPPSTGSHRGPPSHTSRASGTPTAAASVADRSAEGVKSGVMLDHVFAHFDRNQDGVLDFNELRALYDTFAVGAPLTRAGHAQLSEEVGVPLDDGWTKADLWQYFTTRARDGQLRTAYLAVLKRSGVLNRQDTASAGGSAPARHASRASTGGAHSPPLHDASLTGDPGTPQHQRHASTSRVSSHRSEPGAARSVADALHKAMRGLGTDEDAVYRSVGRVRGNAEWDAVKDAFSRAYPTFARGDLAAALKDELSRRELQKVVDILRRNGVDFDSSSRPSVPAATPQSPPAAASAASAPSSVHASGGGGLSQLYRPELEPHDAAVALHIADTLSKAMKGLGTDEDAVYRSVGRVRSNVEWDAVKDAFRRAHPKFHRGDVVAALKDELTRRELQKVVDTLRRNGVDLDRKAPASAAGTPNGGGAVSQLWQMDAQSRASTSAPAQPYKTVADALYKAMKGLGTDEDAVYRSLGRVRGNAEWDAVKDAFHEGYPTFHRGDLVAALKDELTRRELQKAMEVLRRNGVHLAAGERRPGSPGPPPGGVVLGSSGAGYGRRASSASLDRPGTAGHRPQSPSFSPAATPPGGRGSGEGHISPPPPKAAQAGGRGRNWSPPQDNTGAAPPGSPMGNPATTPALPLGQNGGVGVGDGVVFRRDGAPMTQPHGAAQPGYPSHAHAVPPGFKLVPDASPPAFGGGGGLPPQMMTPAAKGNAGSPSDAGAASSLQRLFSGAEGGGISFAVEPPPATPQPVADTQTRAARSQMHQQMQQQEQQQYHHHSHGGHVTSPPRPRASHPHTPHPTAAHREPPPPVGAVVQQASFSVAPPPPPPPSHPAYAHPQQQQPPPHRVPRGLDDVFGGGGGASAPAPAPSSMHTAEGTPPRPRTKREARSNRRPARMSEVDEYEHPPHAHPYHHGYGHPDAAAEGSAHTNSPPPLSETADNASPRATPRRAQEPSHPQPRQQRGAPTHPVTPPSTTGSLPQPYPSGGPGGAEVVDIEVVPRPRASSPRRHMQHPAVPPPSHTARQTPPPAQTPPAHPPYIVFNSKQSHNPNHASSHGRSQSRSQYPEAPGAAAQPLSSGPLPAAAEGYDDMRYHPQETDEVVVKVEAVRGAPREGYAASMPGGLSEHPRHHMHGPPPVVDERGYAHLHPQPEPYNDRHGGGGAAAPPARDERYAHAHTHGHDHDHDQDSIQLRHASPKRPARHHNQPQQGAPGRRTTAGGGGLVGTPHAKWLSSHGRSQRASPAGSSFGAGSEGEHTLAGRTASPPRTPSNRGGLAQASPGARTASPYSTAGKREQPGRVELRAQRPTEAVGFLQLPFSVGYLRDEYAKCLQAIGTGAEHGRLGDEWKARYGELCAEARLVEKLIARHADLAVALRDALEHRVSVEKDRLALYADNYKRVQHARLDSARSAHWSDWGRGCGNTQEWVKRLARQDLITLSQELLEKLPRSLTSSAGVMDFHDVLSYVEDRTASELWLFSCDELMEALDEHAKEAEELAQLLRVVRDCRDLLSTTLEYRRKIAIEKIMLESRSNALMSQRYLSDLRRAEAYLRRGPADDDDMLL